MTEEGQKTSQWLLLIVATLAVSIASLVPLCWAGFILGDHGHRAADPFPDFVRKAAVVSLIIFVVGAIPVSRFWRSHRVFGGLVSAMPHLIFATGSGQEGLFIWSSTGLMAFVIFFALSHLPWNRHSTTPA